MLAKTTGEARSKFARCTFSERIDTIKEISLKFPSSGNDECNFGCFEGFQFHGAGDDSLSELSQMTAAPAKDSATSFGVGTQGCDKRYVNPTNRQTDGLQCKS
jgi:hypothetical protein